MDRNSVTGLALIALIMIVWLQFMSPEKNRLSARAQKEWHLWSRWLFRRRPLPFPLPMHTGHSPQPQTGKPARWLWKTTCSGQPSLQKELP